MSFKHSARRALVIAGRAIVTLTVAVLLVYYSDYGLNDNSSKNSSNQNADKNANKSAERDSDAEQSMSTSKIKNYADARKVFWRQLYRGSFTTLYCGQRFNAMPARGVNIEHVFPMGWATNSIGCGTRDQCRSNALFNQIESDLHNLCPSRSDVNTARLSFRFANIAGEVREFGADCDFEVSKRQRAVEPRPDIRGDIAHTMFYVVDRYPQAKLEIFSKQQRLLKEWHRADPPSAEERARNDAIERIQGNRNPYVDAPNSL
jgi:deoxyribonuclease-1